MTSSPLAVLRGFNSSALDELCPLQQDILLTSSVHSQFCYIGALQTLSVEYNFHSFNCHSNQVEAFPVGVF